MPGTIKAARYLSNLLLKEGQMFRVPGGSVHRKFALFGQKARELYDAVVSHLLRKKETPVPRSDTAVALLRVLNHKKGKFSAPLLHTVATLFVLDGRRDNRGPYGEMLRYQLSGRILNTLPPRPSSPREGRVYDSAMEMVQRERVRLAGGTDAAYVFSSPSPDPFVMHRLFEIHRRGDVLHELREQLDAVLTDVHLSHFLTKDDVNRVHDIAKKLISVGEPTAAATVADLMYAYSRLFHHDEGADDALVDMLDNVRTHIDFWKRPLLLGDIEDTFLWVPHHVPLPYHVVDDADKFVEQLEGEKNLIHSVADIRKKFAAHLNEYASELTRYGEAFPHVKALATMSKLLYHSTFEDPNNHAALHVVETLVTHPKVRGELEDMFKKDPVRAQGFVEAMKKVRFSRYDLHDLAPEVARNIHAVASNANTVLNSVSGVSSEFPTPMHAPVGRLEELRRVKG